MKTPAEILVLMVIVSLACAIETWFERCRSQRASTLFLGSVTFALIILFVALVMHFGRLM